MASDSKISTEKEDKIRWDPQNFQRSSSFSIILSIYYFLTSDKISITTQISTHSRVALQPSEHLNIIPV